MRVSGLILAGLALTACSTRPPGPSAPPVQAGPVGVADTCGASPYLYLIGEDATELERVLILRQVRVNWPEEQLDGSAKPERLNFNITTTGTIASVTCG